VPACPAAAAAAAAGRVPLRHLLVASVSNRTAWTFTFGPGCAVGSWIPTPFRLSARLGGSLFQGPFLNQPFSTLAIMRLAGQEWLVWLPNDFGGPGATIPMVPEAAWADADAGCSAQSSLTIIAAPAFQSAFQNATLLAHPETAPNGPDNFLGYTCSGEWVLTYPLNGRSPVCPSRAWRASSVPPARVTWCTVEPAASTQPTLRTTIRLADPVQPSDGVLTLHVGALSDSIQSATALSMLGLLWWLPANGSSSSSSGPPADITMDLRFQGWVKTVTGYSRQVDFEAAFLSARASKGSAKVTFAGVTFALPAISRTWGSAAFVTPQVLSAAGGGFKTATYYPDDTPLQSRCGSMLSLHFNPPASTINPGFVYLTPIGRCLSLSRPIVNNGLLGSPWVILGAGDLQLSS
jgi:hypothetical protein